MRSPICLGGLALAASIIANEAPLKSETEILSALDSAGFKTSAKLVVLDTIGTAKHDGRTVDLTLPANGCCHRGPLVVELHRRYLFPKPPSAAFFAKWQRSNPRFTWTRRIDGSIAISSRFNKESTMGPTQLKQEATSYWSLLKGFEAELPNFGVLLKNGTAERKADFKAPAPDLALTVTDLDAEELKYLGRAWGWAPGPVDERFVLPNMTFALGDRKFTIGPNKAQSLYYLGQIKPADTSTLNWHTTLEATLKTGRIMGNEHGFFLMGSIDLDKGVTLGDFKSRIDQFLAEVASVK